MTGYLPSPPTPNLNFSESPSRLEIIFLWFLDKYSAQIYEVNTSNKICNVYINFLLIFNSSIDFNVNVTFGSHMSCNVYVNNFSNL